MYMINAHTHKYMYMYMYVYKHCITSNLMDTQKVFILVSVQQNYVQRIWLIAVTAQEIRRLLITSKHSPKWFWIPHDSIPTKLSSTFNTPDYVHLASTAAVAHYLCMHVATTVCQLQCILLTPTLYMYMYMYTVLVSHCAWCCQLLHTLTHWPVITHCPLWHHDSFKCLRPTRHAHIICKTSHVHLYVTDPIIHHLNSIHVLVNTWYSRN